MHEALWEIPIGVGWQLVHAHLSSEGCARSWAKSFGEGTKSFEGWRSATPQEEEAEFDELDL